jgi:hypothetical protein
MLTKHLVKFSMRCCFKKIIYGCLDAYFCQAKVIQKLMLINHPMIPSESFPGGMHDTYNRSKYNLVGGGGDKMKILATDLVQQF